MIYVKRLLSSLRTQCASQEVTNTFHLPADAFNFTSKFSPAPHLAKQKSAYQYEFMTDPSKFDEPHLPPKDKFYSTLQERDITDEDYDRACDVWTAYKCKSMKDFHDAYFTTDVLMLADVFENFRSICMKNYGLDPAHFYIFPRSVFPGLS